MKLENNWKNKSLENLEKDVWSEPEYSSCLVLADSAKPKDDSNKQT
jgi:hypothetical protein